MLNIKRYSSIQPDFQARLHELLAFEGAQDESIDQVVAGILHDVKTRGDAAVLEYTQRFDQLDGRFHGRTGTVGGTPEAGASTICRPSSARRCSRRRSGCASITKSS